jgi:hypothetical protein
MYDNEFNPYLLEINVLPGIYIWSEPKEITTRPVIKAVIDILLTLHENWDNMDEVIKNSKRLPLGCFEEVYNGISGYNILDELGPIGK